MSEIYSPQVEPIRLFPYSGATAFKLYERIQACNPYEALLARLWTYQS